MNPRIIEHETLEFKEVSRLNEYATWNVIWVSDKEKAELGTVHWHQYGRQYAFYPNKNTIIHPTCLHKIAEFIEQEDGRLT